MKNLTKLFVLVALLFAGVACTTDVTEDLGVEVGGQTKIVLSLEQSRTQLGEKAGDLYPLYWSNGDKISVNGVESNALAVSGNSAVATFTVPGTLSAPYCIAYPATSADQVLFADQQSYTEGTFANGASTMYAYSENGLGAQLNHLTGILKIGVTGDKTLSYAQISNVDRTPIAGAFEFDFAKGKATATEASKSVISYSFGEGVTLSSEPTYIHVAVPAGKYDALFVTLYDNEGGVMYATVKASDEKPLAAGAVREFSNTIEYVPTASLFVIKDKESLKTFAAEAPTLEKDVLFVADVDMTGEAWTPIEGYAGTINGNGYSIKGMTAPLFGTTNASIKGLHLVDVNIYETVNPNVAPFARQLSATDTIEPVLEHCSASGKLTVDCQEYVYQSIGTYKEFSVSGLLGYVNGVAISDCVNRVDIDIKQLIAKSNTTSISPAIGGIVGSLTYFTRTDKSTVLSPISNCVNYGNFTVANGSDNGETGYITLHLGGCVGVQFNKNWTTLANLTNYGNITLNASYSSGTWNIAGVIGYCYTTTATKFYNYGDITYNSGSPYGMRIGGAIGYIPDSGIASHLYNDGDILVKDGVKILGSLYVGGNVAYHAGSVEGSLTDCENNGDITIDADMSNDSVNGYFRIGGVASWHQCSAERLTNNGDVKVSSRLFNAQNDNNYLCIAGVIGYRTVTGSTDMKNTGDVTFTGKVETTEGTDLGTVRLNIGGVLGYATYAGTNIYNEGNVTVDGATLAGQLRIGGLFGHCTGKITTGGNSGNVTIKGSTTTGDLLQCGGLAGYLVGGTDTYNSGAVTIESDVTITGTATIGGGVAYNNTNALDGFVNTGAINVQGNFKDLLSLGGCVGTPNVGILNNTNKGAITVNATMNGTNGIGGVIGYQQVDKSGINKYLVNEAPVSVYGTAKGRLYVGGVVGNINMSNGQLSFENKKTGVVTVNMTSTSNIAYIGGCAALIQDSSSDVYNYAPVNIIGSFSSLQVGGAVASQNNYNRTNSFNYGDITISAKTAGGLWAGGLCAGGEYGKTWTNGHNYGDITVTADCEFQKGCFVGGIYGKGDPSITYLVFDNCSNEGNITVSGKSGLDTSDTYELRIGGLSGTIRQAAADSDDDATVTNGFINKGTITYNGSHIGSAMVGGVVGEMQYWTENWTGSLINEGDINCTGTGTVDSYVGGVVGYTGVSFANGEVHCSLDAQGDYKGVGMITGASRSTTVKATNCKVGGKMVGAYNIEDEEYETVSLDASNYFKYIYGSGETTDWGDSTDYDGATFLEAKPSTITPAE